VSGQPIGNWVLAGISSKDYGGLDQLEPVRLRFGQILYEAGGRIRHVYFPIDATISLVTPIDGKPALEVGMVGREGMVGAQLVLGVATTRQLDREYMRAWAPQLGVSDLLERLFVEAGQIR